LVLFQGDGTFGFGFGLGPQLRYQDGHGNPAQRQREVVQPAQEVQDGNLPAFQHLEKVVGVGFEQLFVPQ